MGSVFKKIGIIIESTKKLRNFIFRRQDSFAQQKTIFFIHAY